jgi:hypothetical protein
MKVFYIDSFFNIIEYKTQIRPVLDRFDSNHHCSNLNSRYQKWRVQNRTPYLGHGLVVLLDNLDKTWRVWRYQRFNHNPHYILTSSATSGAGAACPSGAPEFTLGFVLLDIWLCVYVLWIVVCPFVLFPLAVVFFFDVRVVIESLVSSNSSSLIQVIQ